MTGPEGKPEVVILGERHHLATSIHSPDVNLGIRRIGLESWLKHLFIVNSGYASIRQDEPHLDDVMYSEAMLGGCPEGIGASAKKIATDPDSEALAVHHRVPGI